MLNPDFNILVFYLMDIYSIILYIIKVKNFYLILMYKNKIKARWTIK